MRVYHHRVLLSPESCAVRACTRSCYTVTRSKKDTSDKLRVSTLVPNLELHVPSIFHSADKAQDG